MENLFTESFFNKNNYFRDRLNITDEKISSIMESVKNWQLQCETFVKGIDKETSDSGEFINIFFKDILGYHGKGTDASNFTLTSEYSIKGSGQGDNTGSSDLALGLFSKDESSFSIDAQVLVEFKDQSSNDLDKPSQRKDKFSPVNQCLNYLDYHEKASWGIITNYNEVRLYHKTTRQKKYEVFYFIVPEELKGKKFPLSDEKELLKLIAILHSDNLLATSGISNSEDILNQQGIEESQVQDSFYKKYKSLRVKVFNDLLGNNTDSFENNKNELLLLVQKFLDRIIFCWFCEDSREQLLPSNVLSTEIISIGMQSKYYQRDSFNIWSDVKELFRAIDVGGNFNINEGFNGGLFREDPKLDSLKIPNSIFEEIAKIGNNYDFGNENEINVNILGHIFEQSLTDLEEMKASFDGVELDSSKSKRKKDGVFYTPEYITLYIVENTIGALCEEKKKELKLVDLDITGYTLKNKKKLKVDEKYIKTFTNLEKYKEYLLSLKILDPACGSGAFLIQALHFLIKEHKFIDDTMNLIYSSENNALLKDEIDISILENNLYGVDINEESVEIAKLSLWLQTAKKGRKLSNLSDKIKCGNSLIDDEAVAGDKAFDWNKEFPDIMADGGFDVVIGNPPYLVVKGGRWVGGFQYDNDAIKNLREKFKTASQQINTYVLFLELGIKLTKENALISQITPNTFLANEYSQNLREYLYNNSSIVELYNTGSVFNDASVETIIVTYKNKVDLQNLTNIKSVNFIYECKFNLSEIMELTYDSKYLINVTEETLLLLKKLNKFNKLSFYAKVWRGLTTGNDKKYLSKTREGETYKAIITGSEIERYYLKLSEKYVNYIPSLLDRPRDERIFLLEEKLISKFVGNRLTFSYDDCKNYVINTACSTEILDKEINPFFLLTVLNSKLINFYFQQVFSDSRSTFPIMKSGNIEALPIKDIKKSNQQPFIDKANQMLELNSSFHKIKSNFINSIQDEYTLEKIISSKQKLYTFYELSFDDFLKEIIKIAKIKITTAKEKSDLFKYWEEQFEEDKAHLNILKAEIDKTDSEIDKMVYELYNLTDEEIAIVEGNI